ncbi:Peroxisomal biogenesis factor 6 [Smittium culicis]|uniref:Peroxisomal ATPase PEX6 n=1 Tax=Smittium culicis TaxID=133412 RepID=A0A1R1Y3U7_9FUNG|nr:Peroxisomal biogenesis factor 6 [Smittium culicis]
MLNYWGVDSPCLISDIKVAVDSSSQYSTIISQHKNPSFLNSIGNSKSHQNVFLVPETVYNSLLEADSIRAASPAKNDEIEINGVFARIHFNLTKNSSNFNSNGILVKVLPKSEYFYSNKNAELLDPDICIAVGPIWKSNLSSQLEWAVDSLMTSFGFAIFTATIEHSAPIYLSNIILGAPKEDFLLVENNKSLISDWLTTNYQIFGNSSNFLFPRNLLPSHYQTSLTSLDKQKSVSEYINLSFLSSEPSLQGLWNPKITTITILETSPSLETNETAELRTHDIFAEQSLCTDLDALPIEASFSINQDEFNSLIHPAPNDREDIQGMYGFTSLQNLFNLGLVSGDWALITPNSIKSKSRIIRVFGSDIISKNHSSTNAIYLSKFLIANIYPEPGPFNKPVKVSIISLNSRNPTFNLLTPSIKNIINDDFEIVSNSTIANKFESLMTKSKSNKSNQPNLFPTAKKLVLSRVSTSVSSKKEYEQMASALLKKWLSGSQLKLVKKGDFIFFDLNRLSSVSKSLLQSDLSSELSDLSASPSLVGNNELTPFADPNNKKIDSIRIGSIANDYSYESNSWDANLVPKNEAWVIFKAIEVSLEFPFELDTINATFSKELVMGGAYGCLIDPNVTQVMIEGSVNCFLPYPIINIHSPKNNISQINSEKDIPFFPIFSRIKKLFSTSIHKISILNQYTTSLIIRGSIGCGKKTIISKICQSLGLHIYTVHMSDLIPKLNGKNISLDGLLEIYLENALRYVPGIILIKGLELAASYYDQNFGETSAHESENLSKSLQKTFKKFMDKSITTKKLPLLIVGTFSISSNEVSPTQSNIISCFQHEFSIPIPTESDRFKILESCLSSNFGNQRGDDSSHHKSWLLGPDVDAKNIAKQTASFVARDFKKLVVRAKSVAWKRVKKSAKTSHIEPNSNVINNKNNTNTFPVDPSKDSSDLVCLDNIKAKNHSNIREIWNAKIVVINDDFEKAISTIRSTMSDSLGVPKIPNIKWEDVGGLEVAKKDILDTIRLPLESPHLIASGMSIRSGLLFYGPPGTGKTLLAKAIATECNLNFFSVKGPELLNMYIGESEANVRRVFQKAREASPCVVFFDELDSLAPKRGQFGDSGGVMDRVVSQLLAELDGMSGSPDNNKSNKDKDQSPTGENDSSSSKGGDSSMAPPPPMVFVIGATNRPDLLDSALLRPGRFDKMVYLGVSNTHDSQLNILKALTRKLCLSPDLDLQIIAEKCDFNLSGADFYALCSDAQLKATLRSIRRVDYLVDEYNSNNNPNSSINHKNVESNNLHENNKLTDINSQQMNETQKSSKDSQVEHPWPVTASYYLDHIASDDVKRVEIIEDDFTQALSELVPSISFAELERYQALKEMY